MEIFHKIISFIYKYNINSLDKFIYYKIIDRLKDGRFILQCINLKAIVSASLNELVDDFILLYSLHPSQACFIGMEYGQVIIKNSTSIGKNNKINLSYRASCKIIFKMAIQNNLATLNFHQKVISG